MADKFPEIDDVHVDTQKEGADFLSREKEAVGDAFQSAADPNINDDDEEFEEFEEFKNQFPEVGTPEPTSVAEEGEEETEQETPAQSDEYNYESDNSTPVINQFNNLNLNESEHVKEWKNTRDLEISKRDEIAARKLDDIKKEAEKSIDDFYDNYNNKKEDAIAETKKEETEFLAKRDQFLENGTTWDRIVKLLNLTRNSDSVDSANHRDKTKFRDLLLALTDKTSVPGASA